jgi:CBS domain-containing protein
MGTKISEVMTTRPRAVEAQTSVREAARLMESEDVGSLPVVQDGARLVGVVTDRDIAVRVVGGGLDPDQTSVAEIATREPLTLTPDDDLDDALTLMARAQVRRVPIVLSEGEREGELVGVVSQADIARSDVKDKHVGEVVEAISRPRRGPRVTGDSGGEPIASRKAEDSTSYRREEKPPQVESEYGRARERDA